MLHTLQFTIRQMPLFFAVCPPDRRAKANFCGRSHLDLACGASQTRFMAHSYIRFDFGTDEEKAQQARHKLDGWRQAFRLDKRLQYKLDRPENAPAETASKPEPAASAALPEKSKGKAGGGRQRQSGLARQALFFFARKVVRTALAGPYPVRGAIQERFAESRP